MSTHTVGLEEKEQIVHGSLWLAIWDMSWPTLLNMCIWGLGSFVDMWVAGRLDADAQAAMGIGWQIRYLVMMLTMAMAVGTTAIVSRYYGAGDLKNAIEASKQSLIFAGVFGVASIVIGFLACKSILLLLGASAGVQEQGWNFLRFAVISNLPSTLLWITQSIFRAIGAPRLAMMTSVVAVSLIMVLDVLFCIWPLRMGIGGIGLAWIIASSAGFAWNVVKLRDSEIAACLHIVDSLRQGISKEWFMRFIKIGLPGCIQDVAVIVGCFGLFYILSHTGQPTVNQAAWSVGWRIEEIVVFLPMVALNIAIATIVGQNLGAGQYKRAEDASWKMAYLGFAINVVVAIILWCFAPLIANLVSSDIAVAAASVDYLHSIAWSEPLAAISIIFSGAMQGAGYTRVPMTIIIICLDILRLAAAWYLTVNLSLGANATWIVMAITSAMAGIAMALTFKYGRWKHQTV